MDIHADPNNRLPGSGAFGSAAPQPPSISKRKLVRRVNVNADGVAPLSPSAAAADGGASSSITSNSGMPVFPPNHSDRPTPTLSPLTPTLTPRQAASASPAATSAVATANNGVQDVTSTAEANALVKRLRQLESENAMLSNSLTKICDENGQLTGQVSELEAKIQTMATEPLKETSVLRSLFEPEKTGWFGGSKTAAREQLEKLSIALQSEFMAYRAGHASSNEEVQALVQGLHNAHQNAQDLAKLVHEQQEAISHGPLSVSVRVVPVVAEQSSMGAAQELQAKLHRAQEASAAADDQLRSLQMELRTVRAENTKLKSDAAAKVAATPPPPPAVKALSTAAVTGADKATVDALAKATAERDALRDNLAKLRNSIVEKDKAIALQKQQLEELQHKLAAKDSVHSEEVDELRQKLAESFGASMACGRCDDLRVELAQAHSDLDAAHTTVQQLRAQIIDNTAKQEEKYRTLERKLADSSEQMSAKDHQLQHSTSVDEYERLKAEQETLTNEIDLYRQRIAFLEESHAEKSTNANGSLDETEVLDMLNSSKDRISKLEFERDQLSVQLKQAQAFAAARNVEAKNLQQHAEEDKQRVAFLLKKCASLTSDVRSVTTQLDTVKEQFEKQSLELKHEKRNTEGMAALQKQFDDLTKEKKLLDDRLAATQQVEERLVKAKETIAYMELAQSSNINMSQYAELKAEKEKLANTMEPLQRKLEEAKAEIERLKSVTDAQQAISSTQNNNVRTWQDQATALSDSEAKLREKVSTLSIENTRLVQVNATLEQQMDDMQGGIKEMALHMEQDRTTSKAAAEAASQKEIQSLKDQLAQAKATIADVHAKDGQYVAEGLYQSVVAERAKANEEIKRISCELEKHKSEILIYRQTIADLEQENDERVKEIETLQDRYQTDRTSLNDRLTKEQKRTAELSASVASYTEQVAAMQAEAQKSKAAIADLQDKVAKQLRAFEDKCRREEALGDEIKRLQGQISTLQAAEAAAAATFANNGGSKQATAAATTMPSRPPSLTSSIVMPPHEMMASAPTSPNRAAGSGTANPTSNEAAPPPAASRSGSPAPSTAGLVASALVTPPPTTLTSSGPDPMVIETFQKRIYDLQTDNERLAGELKRTQMQRQADAEEDRRTITMLQTQVKNKMSSADRAAYTAAIAKADGLKKSVESLMDENAKLKQQMERKQSLGGQAASATSVAFASAKQMDALQLQAQLQEQKNTFDLAMEKAVQDRDAYEAQIKQLEEELQEAQEQLHETQEAAAHAAATAVPRLASMEMYNTGDSGAEDGHGAGAGTGDDTDPSPLGKPAKKKVRRIKKKKTLAEQVGAVDDGEDILAVAMSPRPQVVEAAGAAPFSGAAAAVGGSHTPTLAPLTPRAAENATAAASADLQGFLTQAQRELTQVKAENTQLKATIADLTAQVQQTEDDLHAAYGDLEQAQNSFDEERRDLNKQIAMLQENRVQRQVSMDDRQSSGLSRNSSFGGGFNKGSFRNQSIAESQMQLRCCQDELTRLKTENKELQYKLDKATDAQAKLAPAGSHGTLPTSASHTEARKLQKMIKQKDAEIKVLSDQLMPTKEKLVEYMAMADRLGLQYPFPPELEGATVMRLKALHMPTLARSASAPAPPQGGGGGPRRSSSGAGRSTTAAAGGGRVGLSDASPLPRTPQSRRAVARSDDDGFSLR